LVFPAQFPNIDQFALDSKFILKDIQKSITSFHNQEHHMKTPARIFLGLTFIILVSSFQLIKTYLTITVRDEVGNTVAGATVQLFEKEEDYTKEENIVMEGVTDNKGVLKLKDLKAISYFVIVKKDDKDNSGGGERTAKLDDKKINKVTIVIQ
jgi:hypothetical protein